MRTIYWLASYPKSGNTWFRIFLQNLRNDGDAPADINTLDSGSVASGRLWLDAVLAFDTADLSPDEIEALRPDIYEWWSRDNATEYHKIHDAYWKGADGRPLVGEDTTRRALYFIRNPLDVAPSYAHHAGSSIDHAIDAMADPAHLLNGRSDALRGQVRQRLLTWSQHVLSWVDAAEIECLPVRYEDMTERPHETFAQAARFLDFDPDPALLDKAIRFSTFDEVRRQEATNGFRERPPVVDAFFRAGQPGSWRRSLTDRQVERLVADHGVVMRRFGYLDAAGRPI